MKEIESLKAFEQLKSKPIAPIQAPLATEDTDTGSVAGSPPKSIASAQQQIHVNKKSVSFTCDQTSEHNCELQEFMHGMDMGKTYLKRRALYLMIAIACQSLSKMTTDFQLNM
jgi:hypothetical protein